MSFVKMKNICTTTYYPCVKLGDIFEISSGGTPSKTHNEYYECGEIPWIKSGDLKEKYVNQDHEFITREGLNNSSSKLFPPNTVLIAMYGATIGACSILDYEASSNQACAAFIPNNNCLPDYLYYFLKSQTNRIINMGVGGAQPNISATILKQIGIPLPPIKTQMKISNLLDEANHLIDLRKKQIQKTELLIKSQFAAEDLERLEVVA